MTPTNENKALALREDRGVVPSSAQIVDVQRLGEILAKSGYFSDARDMAQAAVKVMAGAELGIPPIAAMMGIHVIKGKATLGAHLIASRVRAHGYDFEVKRLDNTGCVVIFNGKADAQGKRRKLGESAFLEEDAKAAGVFGNDTWKKFPRNMYYARAMSNGSKWFTPEISAGMPIYTPEEMGATVDGEGDVIPPPAPSIADRRIEEERSKLADVKIAKPAAKEPAEPDEIPEVIQTWEYMALGLKQTLEAFKCLKEDMTRDMGAAGEAEYYRILARYDVKHANEFVKGPKANSLNARQCVKSLWVSLKFAQAMNVTDADVPEVVNAD